MMARLPKWLRLWFLLGLMLALVMGCQSTSNGPQETIAPAGSDQPTITLNGTGASFPMLFYDKLFSEYRQVNPEVLVNYQPTGSAAGIQQLISRTVDFAASDVAMTDEDIAQVESGVIMVPMTAGSVALAYNLPGLDKPLKLSREAYAGIFLGEVNQWNDPQIIATNPNVTLPNLPIILVHRSDGSGTTAALTAHLSAVSPEWSQQVGSGLNVTWPTGVGIKSNAGVSAQIQQAEGAIGYVEYSYAKKLGLSVAALENQAGNFIQPSETSAQTGLQEAELPENLRAFVPDPKSSEAYPIVTYTWLLLYANYDDKAKANAIKDMVHWGLTNGQAFSGDLGYVPLPDAVVEKSSQALAKVNP
jgi:phosphate transport system substrate-binding protein